MIFTISDVLTTEELSKAREAAAKAKFLDGKITAGWAAVDVKNLEQADAADPHHKIVSETVRQAIARSPVVSSAALPRTISRLLISRCRIGMGYGQHADNAVMGNPPIRTDLAFTVFLNGQGDFTGGELVIEDAEGSREIVLPAGSMVLYSASTLHRVEPVVTGERLVAVGWIQSLVRDAAVREMLFDLNQAKLELAQAGVRGQAFDLISKTQSNLMRRYVEI